MKNLILTLTILTSFLAVITVAAFLVLPLATEEGGMKGISVQEHIVFNGDWSHEGVTYRLAVAPIVEQAPNGDLLCAWLSGSGGEPATDNCVLLSRSTDRGKTWSAPKIIVPAGKMAGALTIMHTTKDGRLIALGAHWPAEKEYTEWHWFQIESEDNGETWSKPKPFELYGNHASITQGEPVRLANGEYLLSGTFFDKRPDPLVAPMQALVHAQSEKEALAMPKAEGNDGGKFFTYLHGSGIFISMNDDITELTKFGHINNRPMGLLESSCVQLKDGTLVMIIRAEFGGFLWRAESKDNGRTWTKAWQTDIPNPTSLAHVLRLPDGRIALINNNSGGKVGSRAQRKPLSIWISDDEMKTWSIKEDIRNNGENLAYPSGMILDGKLAFVYDWDRSQSL